MKGVEHAWKNNQHTAYMQQNQHFTQRNIFDKLV